MTLGSLYKYQTGFSYSNELETYILSAGYEWALWTLSANVFTLIEMSFGRHNSNNKNSLFLEAKYWPWRLNFWCESQTLFACLLKTGTLSSYI
jgi:hypothetical protein